MTLRSIAPITRTLLTTAEKVEAKISSATKKALDQKLALAERINAYVPDAPALSAAVVDALSRDVDPLTDPKVLQAHLAEFIGQVRHGFPETTNWQIQETLRDEWPNIITAFKVPFDRAGEQLREAHKKLTEAGVLELTNTAPSNSETLAVTWVRAHEASRTIRTICNMLGSSTVVFGWSRYIGDARTYDTHGEPTDHRFKTPPWDALGKGWTISLATAEEYDERLSAEEDTRQTRQRAQDLEQKRQNGRISNLSMH